MARTKKAFTQMKEAIKQRDVSEFLWACLLQSQEDMTKTDEEKIFTSDQVIWLIKQLVSLRRISKETGKKLEDPSELDQWLNSGS